MTCRSCLSRAHSLLIIERPSCANTSRASSISGVTAGILCTSNRAFPASLSIVIPAMQRCSITFFQLPGPSGDDGLHGIYECDSCVLVVITPVFNSCISGTFLRSKTDSYFAGVRRFNSSGQSVRSRRRRPFHRRALRPIQFSAFRKEER